MSSAAFQTYSPQPNQQQARSRYLETDINTADPFELVLILYRGAIQNLSCSLDFFASRLIEKRVNAINRAGAMIGELQSTLDFEKGGQIASSLDRLYAYMLQRLLDANLQQDPLAVQEVIKLLKTLVSAWEEAQSATGSPHPASERIKLSA